MLYAKRFGSYSGFECVDKPSKRPLKQMRTPKNANKLPSQANYDPFLTHMAAGYAQPTPESVDYYRRATAPVTHTPHAHGHAAHGHVQYSVAPGSGYDAYARTSGASQTSYFPYAPPTLPSSSAPGSFFPSAPPPPNFPHAHGAAYAPYAPISLQGDAYPPASPPAYAQWPPSASLSAASGAVAAAPGAAAPPAVHPASAPLLPGSGVVGGASASAGAGGSVDVGGDTHRAFLPFKGVRRKPVVFAGTYNQREAAVELAPSTSVADLRALVQERLGAQDEELLLTYMRGGDRVVVHDETDLDQLLANPHLGEIELFVKRGRLAPTTFPASGDS